MNEANEKFWNLPKEEKIIAIAKDVILQLQQKTIEAARGTYVTARKIQKLRGNTSNDLFNYRQMPFDKAFEEATKLKTDFFDESLSICDCCGLGACLISLARLGNKYTVREIIQGSLPLKEILRKVFSPNQMTLIECAFELAGHHFTPGHNLTDAEILKAVDFGWNWPYDGEVRLTAIMQNIIDNNGTFKP